MAWTRARGIAAALSVTAVLLSTPTESYAIFHWFSRLCGGCCSTPCAQPVIAQAPVTTNYCCPQQQVCRYVPQTCYRQVCRNVPVTTYRPITSRDPCTGCPVTCYRPCTTYVRQVQRVPYTTYRLECSTVQSPTCCTPTTTTVQSPTCCTPTTTPAVPVPSTTIPSTTVPSTTVPAPTTQPSLNNQPGTPQTFEQPQGTQRQPVPDVNNGNGGYDGSSNRNGSGNYYPSSSPQLLDPTSRTTMVPQMRVTPGAYNRVSWPSNQSSQPVIYQRPGANRLDDSGWTPALR